MSAVDRVLTGIKNLIDMRGEISRTSASLDKLREMAFDHEKRLIRIETIVDIARRDLGPLRLPSE